MMEIENSFRGKGAFKKGRLVECKEGSRKIWRRYEHRDKGGRIYPTGAADHPTAFRKHLAESEQENAVSSIGEEK